MSKSILSASAKGATFLILLQVGSRALTFAVNQVLLRFLSPELLGISSQLELYSISVLYFARESIRVAVQRQATGTQAVVNLAYIAILLGVFLAYVLAALYLRVEIPNVPYFVESLGLYGVAAIIELLAEPSFAAVQQNMLYKIRASTETAATIAKCFATCGFAIWAAENRLDVGPLPFAVGQAVYAFMLLLSYVHQLRGVSVQDKFSLLLTKVPSNDSTSYVFGYFSKPLCSLTLSMYLQSAVKYVLTQGDSLLIASLASLRDQGAYALASNYGGLVARMLFQPIEETSRNLFAKLCALQPKSQQPTREGIKQSRDVLRDVLKLYHLISLVACSLGPTLAPLLLRIVAGAKWADTGAGEVLATYSYYIPLLALNGVTEAFVAAVASNSELRAQSVWMGVFFAGFASSAYLFLGVLEMGAQGLVYANCVNMLLRIVWGLSFIRRYVRRNGEVFSYADTLPSAMSIVAAVWVPAALKTTTGMLLAYGPLGDLLRTGAIGSMFGISLLLFERDYVVHCARMFKPNSAGRSKTG